MKLNKYWNISCDALVFDSVLATSNECIFGVELEIEDVPMEDDEPTWRKSIGMIAKEDGSLRNNGMEYITSPMYRSELIKVLNDFLVQVPDTDNHYSERTSIHVHMNVCDMDDTQLAALLMVYQVLEKLLFQFIGKDRDKNIFCVPLSEAVLSYRAVDKILNGELVDVVERWQKYAALNLRRLPDLGTVEFRHMAGTSNMQFIQNWLEMLNHMRNYAMETPIDVIKQRVVELNTSSQYTAFINDTLGNFAAQFAGNQAQILLEDGVMNAKYSMLKPKARQKKYTMYFDELIQERMNQEVVRIRLDNPIAALDNNAVWEVNN